MKDVKLVEPIEVTIESDDKELEDTDTRIGEGRSFNKTANTCFRLVYSNYHE